MSVWGNEPVSQPRGKPLEALEVRTYPVADLVVPIPPAKTSTLQFAELERYLRELTGAQAWNENDSIKPYEKTLSLVIRQTPSVHDRIAKALNHLRSELDVQTVVEFRVVTGPRKEIAALAAAFPGEFGKSEVDQLLQLVEESKTLKLVLSPKLTTFSRQTAQIQCDGRTVQVNATVAADRRSLQLKVVEGAVNELDLLADVQMVTLHSGRSAALRFEAGRKSTIIPPAVDAEERLVIVTARVIIAEEVVEPKPKTVLMVTPRGPYIIEEELLGIPTE